MSPAQTKVSVSYKVLLTSSTQRMHFTVRPSDLLQFWNAALLACFLPSFFQLAKTIDPREFNITGNVNFLEELIYSNLPVCVEYVQAQRWSM